MAALPRHRRRQRADAERDSSRRPLLHARDDRDPGLLDVHALDLEIGLATPLRYLFWSLAVAVERPEPVEVDVVHLLRREVGPIKCLADVPVEEPLNVD